MTNFHAGLAMSVPLPFVSARSFSVRRAFSIIEVVIALGLVAFCLVAIMGLLPLGLRSVRESNEQAGAANAIAHIAEAIRGSTSSVATPGTFNGVIAGQPFTYSLGGGPQTLDLRLSGNGAVAGSPTDERLAVRVKIVAPATGATTGTAEIGVAWPAAANPTRNDTTGEWSKAQGSVNATIRFLPRP